VNDARDMIRARIESLQDELSRIAPHAHNSQRIADRRRMIDVLNDQLARIERMHDAFLMYRAELLARCDQFTGMPRGR
jgi:hypothetical protein